MSQSSTLIVVSSHAAHRVVHEVHDPFWRAYGCPMLTYFPDKSADGSPGAFDISPAVAHGTAAPADNLSTTRFLWLLRYLRDNTNATHFMLFSHKTISLEAQNIGQYPRARLHNATIPGVCYQQDSLWGSFPAAQQQTMNAMQPPSFPLFFSRAILEKMLKVMEVPAKGPLPEVAAEMSFWPAIVVEMARKGVPCATFGSYAYATNFIQNDKELECQRAIESGARLIHGIQSQRFNDVTKQLEPNDRQARMYAYAAGRLNAGDKFKGVPKNYSMVPVQNPADLAAQMGQPIMGNNPNQPQPFGQPMMQAAPGLMPPPPPQPPGNPAAIGIIGAPMPGIRPTFMPGPITSS